MSVDIRIKNAVKRYGENTVIKDLSVEIKEGEFFTLLGPSGCGKTTLLRMIAGFNSIEGGDFFFGERRVNDMDPAKRNIGMVFQNYAIFPNMTVKDNVAFGLKNRKVPKDQCEKETDEFLKLMQIDEYRDRMPERLSGGQQQRVALARALVIKPDVLLMDEPLSNLDAKLRVEMRTAIKEIQNRIGITTVYVTHDQEEAMAVSDRIAVMDGGVIQQIGRPRDLYQRPENLFVATFIGRTNVLDAKLECAGGKGTLTFTDGHAVQLDNIDPEAVSQAVKVSVRPEEFVIQRDVTAPGVSATVDDSVFLGLNTHYFVHLDSGEKVEIVMESEIENSVPKGTAIKLAVKTLAQKNGLHATFMPKPVSGAAGSGMHVNMSLFRDGKNALYDEADPRHLSPLAYQFIAGLLGHVRGCCAVTNPLVNSYKRLVPGYEAPCYLAWSTGNRSALVRIPTPRGNSTRVELRSPDPACNPYLALAACLAAGLDGIEQQMTPPAPLTGNLYEVGDASGIQRLPGSLEEAVRALEADSVITDALGAHVTEQYLAGKRRECRSYAAQVSQWELEQYLVAY